MLATVYVLIKPILEQHRLAAEKRHGRSMKVADVRVTQLAGAGGTVYEAEITLESSEG